MREAFFKALLEKGYSLNDIVIHEYRIDFNIKPLYKKYFTNHQIENTQYEYSYSNNRIYPVKTGLYIMNSFYEYADGNKIQIMDDKEFTLEMELKNTRYISEIPLKILKLFSLSNVENDENYVNL